MLQSGLWSADLETSAQITQNVRSHASGNVFPERVETTWKSKEDCFLQSVNAGTYGRCSTRTYCMLQASFQVGPRSLFLKTALCSGKRSRRSRRKVTCQDDSIEVVLASNSLRCISQLCNTAILSKGFDSHSRTRQARRHIVPSRGMISRAMGLGHTG